MALFDGMQFLLVPSGSKTAKVKEAAFIKQGASIQKQLSQEVTHVLVTKRHIPKLGDEFKDGPWLVLQEDWASDSIAQKTVLEPEQYLAFPSEPSIKPEEEPRPNGPAAARPLPSLKRRRSSAIIQGSYGTPARSERAVHETDNPPMLALISTAKDMNPNQRLIDFLTELANERDADGKEFSKRAYRKAVKTLEGTTTPITSGVQAHSLFPESFGHKLIDVVEDVLHDRISQGVREKLKVKTDILALFQTIYGVGATKAREFYRNGWRTLEDVQKNTKDKRMLASIEHHDDLVERISRYEVEKHYAIVKETLRKLDEDAECFCMGSFRRGEPDCGDIDIIITKDRANTDYVRQLSGELVDVLFETGLAKFTFGGGMQTSSRWLGASALPNGKWRRMDILAVPSDEIAAAIIYYTGNDIFNRQMRFRAAQVGMHLNDKGLWDDGKINKLEGRDEKRIFELLGIEWREPGQRYPENFKLVDGAPKGTRRWRN